MDSTNIKDNSWILVKPKKKRQKRKPIQNKRDSLPISTQSSFHQPSYSVDRNSRTTKQKRTHYAVKKSNSGIPVSRLYNEDSSNVSHKRLRHCVKQAIIQGRNTKKLTRVQLAQQIHVKSDVLRSYEIGNPILNLSILHKLQKVLAIRLIGKQSDIGKPFFS